MTPRGESPDVPGQHEESSDGTGGAVRRMRRAIAEASRGSGSRAELEAAAVQLVHQLRGANAPPEQMLLQIKRLLAEAGLRPSYAKPLDPETPLGAEAAVYRDVIAWSIRHYYTDGRGADGNGAHDGKAPKADGKKPS